MSRRPPVLALVQPGSVSDMVHVRALLATILPVVRARTADVRADVARGKELRRAADVALAGLKTSQATLVSQRNQLAALAVERRTAADRLTGNAMAEQDRAIALGEDARDIVDLIGRIDNDASRRALLAEIPGPALRPARPGDLRALPADTPVTESAQARYRLPVIGQIVTGLGEISETGVRARGLGHEHGDLGVLGLCGSLSRVRPYRHHRSWPRLDNVADQPFRARRESR